MTIPARQMIGLSRPLLYTSMLLAFTIMGCGGSDDGRMSASGTVTLDGEPLPSGTITFYQNNASAGVGIIENGQFTVSEAGNSSGIQPGNYEVAIQSWEVEPGGVTEDGEIQMEGKSRIPEKYTASGTSGLSANITEGSNDLSFELSSAG